MSRTRRRKSIDDLVDAMGRKEVYYFEPIPEPTPVKAEVIDISPKVRELLSTQVVPAPAPRKGFWSRLFGL